MGCYWVMTLVNRDPDPEEFSLEATAYFYESSN